MFLLLISVEKDQIPVFEKKPLIWEEDMELYSKFLDRKVSVTFNELLIDVIYYSRILEYMYVYIYIYIYKSMQPIGDSISNFYLEIHFFRICMNFKQRTT